jgi:hypothetical protein
MSAHHRRIPGIDPYIHFQLVAGMAASFHKFSSLASFEPTALFQCRPLSMQE